MKSFLIFRTDRIGDFLVISPIFSSIKRNYHNCKIDIVCSQMNYEYICSFNSFNKIFLYPNNFFKKLSFFMSLKKYDYILVTDGKKRSIYFSIFKFCKKKFLFTPSVNINKLYSFFFNKVFMINYDIPKINIIKKLLEVISCDFKKSDINFLLNHENSNALLNRNIIGNSYIVLNFDEKWIFNNYIDTYDNIEPTKAQFIDFIYKLSKDTNLVIVNGFKKNLILDELNIVNNERIIIKNNINIFELQSIIKHSKCLISCHGAPSHIASNYNIKIIDIVDKSEIKFFESYNFHFANKTQLIRESFNKLSLKILSSLNS
tara:strand:+ start:1896 stop:2846 length:951 start_codon:yes stop_codon:yes gene_type:complete